MKISKRKEIKDNAETQSPTSHSRRAKQTTTYSLTTSMS